MDIQKPHRRPGPSDPYAPSRQPDVSDFPLEKKYGEPSFEPVVSQTAFPKEIRRSRSGSLFRIVLSIGFGLLIVVIAFFLIGKLLETKQAAVEEGERGYQNLRAAAESLKAESFDGSLRHFDQAAAAFAEGEENLDQWGGILLDLTEYVPGLSQAASGKYVLEAGKHFALAGAPLSRVAERFSSSKDSFEGKQISFLDLLLEVKEPMAQATKELEAANEALGHVSLDDLPADKREKFMLVKEHLPVLIGLLQGFDEHERLFQELLGGNGPRKYLFLLQNNHEMRATGGFIGTYGLLDVNQGVVRKFFVDGIFNPDGQLKENIVPPKAIQKVSAGWSLHDSNWFPDFPMSAEKAIFFYEKTGGPTVDGVIALTPTVMQKLLAITGPIDLPEYGLTVDADNFIPVIQEQVEEKYDKEENQPKKVLADLSVRLLEKVFASRDMKTLSGVAEALVEGLNEKHILLYARDREVEDLIDRTGWSGRVLETPKDYLSVIHTNINGYKTDGVVEEEIVHKADIRSDGSIVDTVTVTRRHRGGDTPYEWWNKVNADYMRVYVPKGSELLSAKGATWEFPDAPLDYDSLGFRRDPDIEREEAGIRVDEKSGTRVYEDTGKTVFGAWVYVSPKESVTVEYQYRLPFRLDMGALRQGGADSYGILFQKQSGSIGSSLSSAISFPQGLKSIWQTSENLVPYGRELKLEGTLRTDMFTGAVFGLEQ